MSTFPASLVANVIHAQTGHRPVASMSESLWKGCRKKMLDSGYSEAVEYIEKAYVVDIRDIDVIERGFFLSSLSTVTTPSKIVA